jgi:DNA polymerase-3 subunit delta
LSLFASRRVLELRMPTPKPGDAGAKAIRALAEEPDPDRLVILSISARIDQRVARSVWVKAIEEHGVVVEIRPIGREALPRWIASRAREEGLRFSTDAAELLADRAEGNLLAADQEIKKLALIGGDREITAADVAESVAEGARYDVFRLSDALVSGNLVRALTVLSGLEAEGSAPPLVVWAIVKELTLLAQIKQAELAGDDVDAALARLRVWPSRRTTLKRAARQLSWSRVRALLEQAETVDRGVKGAATVPPWQLIRQLTLDTIRSLKRVHA